MANKKAKALEPALIQLAEGEGSEDRLLGNVCSACSLVFFPARRYCAKCCEKLDEAKPLSRRGRLISFTRVNRKPKHAVVEPPYVVGEVRLPEGVTVISLVKSSSGELKLGAELELTMEKIGEDEEGDAVVGYSFEAI